MDPAGLEKLLSSAFSAPGIAVKIPSSSPAARRAVPDVHKPFVASSSQQPSFPQQLSLRTVGRVSEVVSSKAIHSGKRRRH